jgi:hypothetical protein
MNPATRLVACVREFAELTGEVDTPCRRLLLEAGERGVEALANLIESERDSENELVACFAAELLASYRSPTVVPVLLRVLENPGTTCPDEVRESIFNHACGNDALLDETFLTGCRKLRQNWRPAGCGTDLLDQFLKWATDRSG